MKKREIYSTIMHAAELLGIVVFIKGIDYLFPDILPTETIRDTLLVVCGALLKYARASDTVPLDDYVNDVR